MITNDMAKLNLEKLVDKSLSKQDLLIMVKKDNSLVPELIEGMNSTKAAIRYGCGSVLMDLSETNPDKIYPQIDELKDFLDSKYRILVWQSLAIIANLARVDSENKFDKLFDKYYNLINAERINLNAEYQDRSLLRNHLAMKLFQYFDQPAPNNDYVNLFINDEYMVTVANVVGHSGKIALAKPHLTNKILNHLLSVDKLRTGLRLTEECKKVIAEKSIQSIDQFYQQIENKQEVINFVKKYVDSSRKSLKKKAEDFVNKWE